MSKYYQMVENFTSTDPFSMLNVHGDNGSIKITQIYDSIFNKL